MPPISTTLKTIVKPQDTLGAFLVFLQKRFPYLNHQEWLGHIETGRVRLNGEVSHPQAEVRVDDEIAYDIIDHDEGEFPTEIPTIWEDQSFLLVSKPADLPMHRSGRIFWHTLTNLVRLERQDDEIYPLHRLDRETSGLVLLVQSSTIRRQLKFALDRVLDAKTYLAWVHGDWMKERGDQTQHLHQALAEHPESKIKVQMYCFEGEDIDLQINRVDEWVRSGVIDSSKRKRFIPKEAHSEVRCLWSGTQALALAPGRQIPMSLLEVKLHTGRKHQIRAHLAHAGFPIIGDKIYAHQGKYYLQRLEQGALSLEDFEALGASTQLLHAYALRLKIPPLDDSGKIRSARYADLETREFESRHWSEEFGTLMPEDLKI